MVRADQAGLAVLQAHHLRADPRSPLGLDEREHIRRGDGRWLLADDREEHFEVEGHGQPAVQPEPGTGERQVLINDRMPQRDRLKLSTVERALQQRGPGHGWGAPFRIVEP